MIKKKVVATILLGLLSGCVSTVVPTMSSNYEFKTIDETNFEINKSQIAYVGQPIIKVKKYEVVEKDTFLQSENDFIFEGGIGSVAVSERGIKGKKYTIMGEISGKPGHTAILLPGSHLSIGINKDGEWDGVVASISAMTAPIGSGEGYEMEPRNTKFTSVKISEPLQNSPYINHEILFSGITSSSINLLYREYTLDNMARAAFSQQLTYPRDTKIIRYQNYQIKVNKIASGEIDYTVIQK